MGERVRQAGKPVGKSGLAKPLHLQRLETALDLRPLMPFMQRVLREDSSSSSSSDSDDISESQLQRGDKLVHGVLTTKEERRSDKLRLYNMDNAGTDEERSWLRSVLLSDSPSEDSDEDEISEERLSRMLKDHVTRQKYASKFYRDPENSQYMYYGAGLLSTYDRWPSMQRSAPLPRAPAPPAPAPRRQRRGGASGGTGASRQRTQAQAREDQRMTIKEEPEDSDQEKYKGMNPRAAARARKKAAMAKKPEVLAARRRKLWQLMVKKELGKVQRTRAAAHKDTLQNCKRMASLCTKHHRQKAMQSQKNMKETVWRCKRLTREMQSYWKRYDRVERETRRRMEKEAEEQRKMDVEIIEAKRQQRKLNFLITQTELYAHFMSKKIGREVSPTRQMRILSQLDEERGPKHLSYLDTYDVNAMKERAARNAADAYQAERARTRQFDRTAGLAGVMQQAQQQQQQQSEEVGEHEQPQLFQGTLKGYQLKGMNWLANLYDQGISGILADEMGLGKTVQCIAFLCHVAERLGVWGPFLVVSPASTLHNWQQEMQRFVPAFKVVPYWGNPNERKILRQFWERRDLHTREAAFHVVITSYQIVVGDFKYMNRIKWQYMILDEAQAIKSSGSQRWKLLLGFSCRNRLLLSGTPIQNSMAELWALLHFIMPTLFDSHDEFNEWFSKDIESHAENKTAIDEKHLSRLHMILKPFMLRRIKKDVENELSDKIEIMVHCPLTRRQNLLYFALKKKIKIDDLLHYSVGGGDSGHSVDKNFTSNLMNLVMQFRKVCNHPELFERRDVRSPFFMKCEDYPVPKIIAEDQKLRMTVNSRTRLLYNKLSIFTTEYINRDLFNAAGRSGMFSFSRFMDLSPEDIYNLTIGDWLKVFIHFKALHHLYKKIAHRNCWWNDESEFLSIVKLEKSAAPAKSLRRCSNYYEGAMSKHRMVICPNGRDFKFVRRRSVANVWSDLLLTHSITSSEPNFYCHADHHIVSIAETMEHRLIRSRHATEHLPGLEASSSSTSSDLIKMEPPDPITILTSPKRPGAKPLDGKSPLKKADASATAGIQLLAEFPHKQRPTITRPCQPCGLPSFIYSPTVKVSCGPRRAYACSRCAAHGWTRMERGVSCAAQLVPPNRAQPAASCLSLPDKQTLVTDAGKLNVLDGLLRRLKAQGHRVLIYSQMTKMIDLLEEYMWHRKHKYMRLDGSSKISARRDMVADFQARSDIFVFLLSTRAGGLGINLTAADTVIFYDSDWNPTVDQQAMDRAHRLGQTKQVTVYRLICKGTIEERIMQRAREKSEIQRMVISGGNFKPDTLKPKEVVSLLLDDEEIEQKYRQRAEERKGFEEPRADVSKVDKDKKRKLYGLSPKGGDVKRSRGSASGGESYPASPSSPFPSSQLQDDVSDSEALVVDIDSPPRSQTPVSFESHYDMSLPRPRRSGRGLRRGRPRGSRRPPAGRSPPSAAAPPAASAHTAVAVRRGPGRPRLRAGGQGGGRAQQHRGRRHRGPLLVPLGGREQQH